MNYNQDDKFCEHLVRCVYFGNKSTRMKKIWRKKRVENIEINFSKHVLCTLHTVVSDLHSLFLMMR